MLDLQIRKMRAELNKSLQTRRSVVDIQADGNAFEAKYGPSIWGCICKDQQTFADLYNAHMQRERESAETWEESSNRAEAILEEIEAANVAGWWKCKWFIDNRPELLDRQDVLDCLEERREYLEIPTEEE